MQIRKSLSRLSCSLFILIAGDLAAQAGADAAYRDGAVAAPAFSAAAGWYEAGFALSLSCPDKGAAIYYTLDGAEPTERSIRYSKPIAIKDRSGEPNGISHIKTSERQVYPEGKVFKGTVVRARAFLGDGMSRVVTRSYFVDEKGPSRYSFPVVSIAVDPTDFFDDVKGIYVPGKIFRDRYDPSLPEWERAGNYTQSGSEWERPGYLEFFEPDGKLGMAQDIGIRIHGGATRTYPQKSLRLYARAAYEGDPDDFRYEVFPGLMNPVDGKPMRKFKRLLLRTSGNDSQYTLFRDAFMTSLVSELDLATQASRPSVLFVNGEYWGIHNIRERIDEYDVENTYKVDKDEVVILENDGVVDVGEEGDDKCYRDMISFLRSSDIRDPAVYRRLDTMMDVSNYMDYQIAQIYFGNHDWPGNNLKFWRARTKEYLPGAGYGDAGYGDAGYGDGRWRWFLYDTDFGFSLYNGPQGYEHRTLDLATQAGRSDWPNPDWSTFILRTLLKNEGFKTEFRKRFDTYLDTIFEPSRVKARLARFEEAYEKEIAEQVARWRSPFSVEAWRRGIAVMRAFAEKRPAAMRAQLAEALGN